MADSDNTADPEEPVDFVDEPMEINWLPYRVHFAETLSGKELHLSQEDTRRTFCGFEVDREPDAEEIVTYTEANPGRFICSRCQDSLHKRWKLEGVVRAG